MKKLFSLFIIFAFSSMVFSGAGFAVKKSLEKDTNYDYIASAISHANKGQVIGQKVVEAKDTNDYVGVFEGDRLSNLFSALKGRIAYHKTTIEPVVQERVLGVSTQKCKTISQTSPGNEKVVDYFSKKDGNYSFAHRKEVAQKLGIPDYTGTASQNLLLVKKLKEQTLVCN